MWTRLSLRARISLLLCMTFLCSAIVGLMFLRSFASTQLRDENETASAAVATMTSALNAALTNSADAPALLQRYVTALGVGGEVHFSSKTNEVAPSKPDEARPSPAGAPDWFVRFIDTPQLRESFPVVAGGKVVGEIVFAPAMDAEIREKWIGFLVMAVAVTGLALLAIAITYLMVGTALRPLRELDRGLGRLSTGDYTHAIPPAGTPDIAGSLSATNHLAATLRAYDKENRSLLRRMVSVQDDERRDLARELHDELGPLMFSIRANAIALTDDSAASRVPDHPSHRLMTSVEALQTINRRILDRLRPNDIDTLGLAKSIEAMIDRTRREAPNLTLHANIDPATDTLDAVVGGTIYRVVQEGLTNVLRHAQATTAWVEIDGRGGAPRVSIADDGVGIADDLTAGRGLIGMRERTQAIGGTLTVAPRAGGGTLLLWSFDGGSDRARG